MKTIVSIIFPFIIISCLNLSNKSNVKLLYRDSLKKIALAHDTMSMFQPIPKEYIVAQIINDSDVIAFKDKCVVFFRLF